jgi:RimJ/RimL family protein N-acetyltransferase
MDFDNLEGLTDRIRLRSGATLTLRFAAPADAELLQGYFRGLSGTARYNRLMSAVPELPVGQLAKFVRSGEADAYSVLASVGSDGGESVVGEVRYAHHPEDNAVEFGISVGDRWQRQGIGAALLTNLECRAAAFGAFLLYGDTLRSNLAMIGLARDGGFTLAASPTDWKQTRLEKQISYAPSDIPCASWRLAALRRGAQVA